MNALLKSFTVTVLCSLMLDNSTSFRHGAPLSTCETMKVNETRHGAIANTTQFTDMKSTLITTLDMFGKTTSIIYRMEFSNPNGIKGFLVRPVQSDNLYVLGTFTNLANYSKGLACNNIQNTAATHSNSKEHEHIFTIDLNWLPPANFKNTVQFKSTIVQSKKVYWEDILSQKFDVNTMNTTQPTASTKFHYTQQQTSSTPTGVSGTLTEYYTGCANSRWGCFGGPSQNCWDSQNCQFLLTFERKSDGANTFSSESDYIEFNIIGKVTNGEWVGFALATQKKKMGKDIVTACTLSFGKKNVLQSMNAGPPEAEDNTKLAKPIDGFVGIPMKYDDGYLICKAWLPVQFTANHISYDLVNKTYYLHFGKGYLKSGSDDEIGGHGLEVTELPFSSNKPVNVSSISKVDSGTTLYPLIIIHGVLMTTAWVGTVSIAIFIARFYKTMWPTTRVLGMPIWFQAHRTLNTLTFLLTLAGLILVFYEVGSFLPAWNRGLHTIAGSITGTLTIIQMVMALLRPHPGASNRNIFNLAHFLVGNGTHIIAMVTLFFAVSMKKAHLSDAYVWMLAYFIGFHCLLMILMELFTKFIVENEKSYYVNSLEPTNKLNLDIEANNNKWKMIVLIIYFIGVVLFLMATIWFIIKETF